MPDTIAEFNDFRARMNDLILGAGNLTINRFFALDRAAYEPGALGTRTKEMLGLVSSLVLRCDDCVTYHVVRCREVGVTREAFLGSYRTCGGQWAALKSWRRRRHPERKGGAGTGRPRTSSTPAMMSTAPTA